MTVCIAAICDNNNSIVIASDMLISGPMGSADLTTKSRDIGHGWLALFSADDISPCLPIIRDANARFAKRENTIEQAKKSCEEAYHNQLQIRRTNESLGRCNLDIKSFHEKGPKKLGESLYSKIRHQIYTIEFDCEFLICGFDQNKSPQIFTVSSPGVATEHSIEGFSTIGAGCWVAYGMLLFHRFIPGIQLARGVYHVCEAKFMAESVAGVGKRTEVLIIHKSSDLELVVSDLVTEIRNAWVKEGQARVPPDIEARIKAGIIESRNE